MPALRVRDLMRKTLLTCPMTTTLGQAATLLARHRIHALIVTDELTHPVGLLSEVDLLAGEWLAGDAEGLKVMRTMTAGQMMSKPLATIDAEAPAAEAATRMKREQIHRLIVTENEAAVGVISVSDLVGSLARASLDRRTVGEVMSRGIVVCLEATPIHSAARAMTERRSRSIIVVDAQGCSKGVVTGFDLLSIVEIGDGTRTVAQVMHPPLTIAPSASLREAADEMIRGHVHRLVVIDPANPNGMPLGLISTSDIVAEMAEPGSVWQSK